MYISVTHSLLQVGLLACFLKRFHWLSIFYFTKFQCVYLSFSYFTKFQCFYLFLTCPSQLSSSCVSKFVSSYSLTWTAFAKQVGFFTVPVPETAFPLANLQCFGFPPLDSLFSPLPLQSTPPPDLWKFSLFFKNHFAITMLSLTNPFPFSLRLSLACALTISSSYKLYSLCHINDSII